MLLLGVLYDKFCYLMVYAIIIFELVHCDLLVLYIYCGLPILSYIPTKMYLF